LKKETFAVGQEFHGVVDFRMDVVGNDVADVHKMRASVFTVTQEA
jgi:hypothetical protein